MSERKQTPDVLSELLGGTSTPAASPVPAPRPAAARRPVAAGRRQAHWQYRVVSFQDYHAWRPRYADGQEQRDWMNAPVLHEYLAEMGEQGWELAGATSGQSLYGSADRMQMYFKRQAG